MKNFVVVLLSLLLFSFTLQAETDTLRVASYNLLNFSENNIEERIEHFQTVLNAIDPDVIICQNIGDSLGMESFLNEILDPEMFDRGEWVAAEGESNNMIYFKTEKFSASGVVTLQTDLRDISLYTLSYNENDDVPALHIASTYLKGSDSADDRQRRLDEVTQLTDYINDEGLNAEHILFGGTFNFYDADEEGYNHLLTEDLFYDPIDMYGDWHDSEEFAITHTQSTRTDRFGGGASGGLDDRFDFILSTHAFDNSEEGWYYLEDSYVAFGNDGMHLNGNINDGENMAVSEEIADALYFASDHLPVVMDICLVIPEDDTTSVDHQTEIPVDHNLLTAYPNPFNNEVTLKFNLDISEQINLSILDLQGRLVETVHEGYMAAGSHQHSLNFAHLDNGIYIARLTGNNTNAMVKLVLLK